jgi:hypothetical protein
MTAARLANKRYRDTHGRPITRDALRKTLRISGARATELRRRLADDANKVPANDQMPPASGDLDRAPQLDAKRR